MEMAVIVQIAVGMGMIGLMWKLVTEVATIGTNLEHFAKDVDDHEIRIRVIEQGVADG